MQLTGTEFGKLHDALTETFDRASLELMVRKHLDERLDVIALGSTLSEIVFALILWAERESRLNDLLAGACACRPKNQELLALASGMERKRRTRPASVVTLLQDIIEYVYHEASVMVQPESPAEVTIVDHSNLEEVLSRRSFVVTRAQEGELTQLSLYDLIGMIIHDAWLAKQIECPSFHFDGKAVSSQDIARVVKLEYDS